MNCAYALAELYLSIGLIEKAYTEVLEMITSSAAQSQSHYGSEVEISKVILWTCQIPAVTIRTLQLHSEKLGNFADPGMMKYALLQVKMSWWYSIQE